MELANFIVTKVLEQRTPSSKVPYSLFRYYKIQIKSIINRYHKAEVASKC